MNRSAIRILNRLLRLSLRDLCSGIGDVERAKRLADLRDSLRDASRLAHRSTLNANRC